MLFLFFGFAWWWLLVLFLVFDFSFLGYVGGIRAGGIAYNIAHNYVAPSVLISTYAVLLLAGATVDSLVFIAGLWFFHVGVDRALGYGPRPLSW